MDMCRKIWAVARINFQRWKGDHRVWLIFVFTGVIIFKEISVLTRYGLDSGKECTAFVLPFMFASAYISVDIIKTLLFLGCLFLLCDAPFIHQVTPYMVIRSRRQCWWLGECLYILLVTFIYILFIMVISSITVLPVASFGEEWGEVIEAFAFGVDGITDLKLQYDLNLGMPMHELGGLYPLGSQVYTFLSVWAVFFVLGLLQYLVSLKTGSVFLGVAAASMFVFLDPLLNNISSKNQILSPVCWVSLASLKEADATKFMSIPYVVEGLVLWSAVLLFAIWRTSRKVTIEVRGEI